MRIIALFLALIEVTICATLYIFGINIVGIFCLVLFLCALICFVLRRRIASAIRIAALLLAGSAFCLFLIYYNHTVVIPAKALDGKSGTVICTVVEEPSGTENYRYLEVVTSKRKADNSNLCKQLKLSFYVGSDSEAFNADIGDVLKANIEFGEIDSAYKKLNYSEEKFISAKLISAEIIGHESSVYTFCVGLRREVRSIINQNFSGDKEALLCGLVLGDVSGMSESLYNDFIACGVCHITAVSGMNIGALCMMIFTLLSFVLRKRKAALISLIPIVIIVTVTGLTPSGIRAGIMCAITFLGIAFLRKTDALNSLGVSIILMLFINPFYICSLGFQLSCSAAAGVIISSKYAVLITDRLKSIRIKIVRLILLAIIFVFAQSVGAVLFTLPFQIFELGYISLITPISSTFVCGASAYALLMCVPAIILHFVPFFSVLAEYVFMLIDILLDYIILFVRLFARVPFSYISFGNIMATMWLGLGLALIGIWFLLNKIGGVRLIAIALLVLLIITLWLDFALSRDVYEVSVLDVGQGFCTVVNYRNKCVIIDCGDDKSDYYALRAYLKSRNITKIEAVLISSDDYTCIGGFGNIYSKYKPLKIVMPTSVQEKLGYGDDFIILHDNEILEYGFVKITALYNGYGCVYLVECGNKRFSVGCTGYEINYERLSNVDFAISGRALPKPELTSTILVSNEKFLPKLVVEKYKNNRIICTKGSIVSVKFMKGKGMTIYEERKQN